MKSGNKSTCLGGNHGFFLINHELLFTRIVSFRNLIFSGIARLVKKITYLPSSERTEACLTVWYLRLSYDIHCDPYFQWRKHTIKTGTFHTKATQTNPLFQAVSTTSLKTQKHAVLTLWFFVQRLTFILILCTILLFTDTKPIGFHLHQARWRSISRECHNCCIRATVTCVELLLKFAKYECGGRFHRMKMFCF